MRKQDVTIAKNYLNRDEIEALDRIVVMYLDYAEDQAQRRSTLSMRDWEDKLDAFLQFNEREVLTHAGNRHSRRHRQDRIGRHSRAVDPRRGPI